MSTRSELENNVNKMELELAAMKATLETMPVEKRIFIQKGDFIVGKRNLSGLTRVFVVTRATPDTASLVCLSIGAADSFTVRLETNYTIALDALRHYTLDKVINKEQAMSLI